jgi:hypothetical protein
MRLKEYLSSARQTQRSFIEDAYVRTGHRIPQGTLAKYLVGQRIPRKREMQIIYEVTNHQVTPNDFYFGEPNE